MSITEEQYTTLVANLDACMDDVEAKARSLVEDHWSQMRAMDARHPGWENKSTLFLRCFKRGNSLQIEWSIARWWGSSAKGNRKMYRTHIAKARGTHAYSLAKLLAHAKEWEKPLVAELEPQLAELRESASNLNKARMYLRLTRHPVKPNPASRKQTKDETHV